MSDYYFYNGQMYSSDELKHFKYVTKKRINGKWRYYYATTSKVGGAKAGIYEKTSGSKINKYGTYEGKDPVTGGTHTVTVAKSNKLLSNTSTISTGRGDVYVTKNVGTLEQSYDKFAKKTEKNVKKAKRWLSDLSGNLKKLNNKTKKVNNVAYKFHR